MSEYIELHARSAFSFLRGAALPEEYVALCSTLGVPAMALTDIDGVYGSPRFHTGAKKYGVKAHVGAEVSVAGGSRYTLLCESRAGYQNLCRLITRMKMRTGTKHPKPGLEAAANADDLLEFAPGLICLTGGAEGPIGRPDAEDVLRNLVRIYGQQNVYVELQRHLNRAEEARNEFARKLADRLKLPVVATNGVAYASPEQRKVFDVFTCLDHKTALADAGRLLALNSEMRLKTPEEMARLFADIPEAIANTRFISSRLKFELSDLGYEFPEYPLPTGETIDSFLAKRTDEGARRRYSPYHDKARTQIEKELKLINQLGLAGYFVIVWDIVRFCNANGILCQGRGSAANSAVCYALGITAVDPVGMNLLFERFLSEKRDEWPDIDIDLPSGDDRERAIQYVYERYGKHGAAMTANVITYRGRSAVREAGKVFGFEIETVEKISKLTPMWGWKDPDHTMEKQFEDAGMQLNHPRIRQFVDLIAAMQDLPRHLGQHSGGMVICQGRLDSVVPIEPASMSGRAVVQWDKDDCADMKIIKVDLLGLGMMAVLKDCLNLVKKHWDEEIDLGRLPADDTLVFETLQKGDTIGMFQVESRAQQATLPRMKPKNFYDLVVEVAIIRPGPIVGDMVHPYLARRAGKEPVIPLHPDLEPVLARTLGVPLFQEQLLRMAMIVADFTGGEAEELRRAMAFKRSKERMREIEVKLRAGMSRRGITGDVQDRIVQSITSFALYGFPESHAASFALIAYSSAYLKCHYLPAFTCAMLNNQPMGFYQPAVLVKDAQRHGLRVLPVDVQVSEWDCTLDEGSLRLGLRYVRGLRAEHGQAIARAKPFHDIDDLARLVPSLHRDEMEALASTGALNRLRAQHRRDALWKAGRAGRPVGPLLSEVPETEPDNPLEQMTIPERLFADYHGTGLTIGRHPLAFRREELNEMGVTPARDLSKVPNGGLVRIVGNVIVRQRPGTAKGIVFLSMEDDTGIANAVVMPDLFDEFRLKLVTEPWLLIEGKIQNVEGVVHVLAKKIEAFIMSSGTLPSHDFR